MFYFTVPVVQRSNWNKERLFHQLVSGNRQQKLKAAARLTQYDGHKQLVSALKSNSALTRELAANALWDLWFNAAGEKAGRFAQAATVAIERQEFAAASKIVNQLTREYPGFAEGWNRRAILNWQLGRYEESIADCKKVVALNPEHFGAWQGMGLCQLHLGDLPAACQSLRAALKINPHDRAGQEFLRRCEELLRRFTPRRSYEVLQV